MDPDDSDNPLADYIATLIPEEREQFRHLIDEARLCDAKIRKSQRRNLKTIAKLDRMERKLNEEVSQIQSLARALSRALRELAEASDGGTPGGQGSAPRN